MHGYAAGDNSKPTLLMRDAFIQNGQYNFFMVDYGPVYISGLMKNSVLFLLLFSFDISGKPSSLLYIISSKYTVC